MEEVIDITPISLDENFSLKSSNFGDGIELLMNDKRRENVSLEMNDLNQLEEELNNLSSTPKTSFFSEKEEPKNVSFENLGEATANTTNSQQTWDGFKKFNEIPGTTENTTPNMTKEEILREKLKYLRKLENLEKKGAELTKKYTMDSSYKK